MRILNRLDNFDFIVEIINEMDPGNNNEINKRIRYSQIVLLLSMIV